MWHKGGTNLKCHFNSQCFNCQRTGHTAAVCRAKPQRDFYKRERRRKPGVHSQDIEEEANKSDESDEMGLIPHACTSA